MRKYKNFFQSKLFLFFEFGKVPPEILEVYSSLGRESFISQNIICFNFTLNQQSSRNMTGTCFWRNIRNFFIVDFFFSGFESLLLKYKKKNFGKYITILLGLWLESSISRNTRKIFFRKNTRNFFKADSFYLMGLGPESAPDSRLINYLSVVEKYMIKGAISGLR